MLYDALLSRNRLSPEESILLLPFHGVIQEKALAQKKKTDIVRRFTVRRTSARMFFINERCRL